MSMHEGQARPALIETAAILPVYCDGLAFTTIHDRLAHFSFFVLQQSLAGDRPGFERVLNLRLIMPLAAVVAGHECVGQMLREHPRLEVELSTARMMM